MVMPERLDQHALVEAITTFLAGRDAQTIDEIRNALARDIAAAVTCSTPSDVEPGWRIRSAST